MENNDFEEIFSGLISVFPVFVKKITKIGEEVFQNEKISKAHLYLMSCLQKKGSCTMSDLGRMLCVSKPNITALVERLVELDMVKRTFDENDRRVIYIERTDKGHDFMEELLHAMKAYFYRSMQNLSNEDVTLFKETLQNMKILADKMGE